MEAGDVLFFEGLGHVGLYLGNGRMVHAPQTGRNVEVVRARDARTTARGSSARAASWPASTARSLAQSR